MFRLFGVFFFLSLSAAAIKVPTERYEGYPDVKNHIGHYPFISALTFRNISNHFINEYTEWFDPDAVKQGDFIYLNLWYLDWFVREVHDRISVPYILVSGDVGGWFPDPKNSRILYDPKLAAWFCKNLVFSRHPKLFQLPMGQDVTVFDSTRAQYNHLISAVVHKGSAEKKYLLHMCFLPRPHGDRDKIAAMFANEPYCYSINRPGESIDQWSFRSAQQFYRDLAESTFTLSPLGLETDSVRTWEALVLGCIPVVEHTFLDPQYEGLPVVIVHDWSEINERFLRAKYEELKGFKTDKAYFDFWRDQMVEVQSKVVKGDLSFSKLDATRWTEEDLRDLKEIVEGCTDLNYVGFLSSMRPFELAEALPTLQIDLYDPWLNKELFFSLTPPFNLAFKNLPISEISSSCFLDLTYYRTSLYIHFNTCVIEDGNFRHSLKKDLHRLVDQLQYGSQLSGNCIEDPYVKKVLDAFVQESGWELKKKGSFWWFVKEKKKRTQEDLFTFSYPEQLLPFKRSDAPFAHSLALEKLILEIGAKRVVDVGPSACDIIKLLPPDGVVFAYADDLQFLSNVVHEELTDRIIPVTGRPRKFLELDPPLDLVFLESCDFDLLQSWHSVLKENGVLCGSNWEREDVQTAVTRFAKERNLFLSVDGDFWMYFLGF